MSFLNGGSERTPAAQVSIKYLWRQEAIERIAAGSLADRKARKSGLIPIFAFEILRAWLCPIFAFLECWSEPFFRCRRVFMVFCHGRKET